MKILKIDTENNESYELNSDQTNEFDETNDYLNEEENNDQTN